MVSKKNKAKCPLTNKYLEFTDYQEKEARKLMYKVPNLTFIRAIKIAIKTIKTLEVF